MQVYEEIYIGNTQQTLKKRMSGHYSDVLRLVRDNKNSDLFAKHFASTLDNDPKPSSKTLQNNMNFSIIWQGNPISLQKSFGTKKCPLCM